MATNLSSSYNAEEDYIDMDLSSCSSSFSFFANASTASPHHHQSRREEFEFQMSSVPHGRDSTTSPADELFYKGKLLPLHLPPRLQMVQKLLQTSTTTTVTSNKKDTFFQDEEQQCCSSSSIAVPSSTNSTTISPSESCRVSCELNPADYFFEWSTELRSFIHSSSHPNKSCWSNKLRLIKQSSFTQKLKASRLYLKSLFSKSACPDESCAKATSNFDSEQPRDCTNKYIKVAKKNPFGYIGRGTFPTPASVAKGIEKEAMEETITQQRRSFSGAIKRHYSTTSKSLSNSSSSSSSSGASSLSSSFSINSNVLYDLQFLRRSSSATLEIDGSIEAAIAHCKSSQQPSNSRNTLPDDAGFCSLSPSKIVPNENPA